VLRRLGLVFFVTACSPSEHASPVDGHPVVDAAVVGDGATDAPIDTPADAMPDAAPVPDTTAPQLVQVTPDGATWLGAPIRFVYDEPLDAVSVTATATLAGTAVNAHVVLEAPSTLVVTLDAGTRGVGSLAVHLAGSVADMAGNTADAAHDTSLLIQPWSYVPVNRGNAASAPKLAVASDGTVYAAWTVGSAGARTVVVSALAGTTWQPLGGSLGDDVTGFAMSLVNGAPVVAWVDGGTVHSATFTSTWTQLPDVGAGLFVALAGSTLAVISDSATLYTLSNGMWQQGTSFTLPAPAASAPMLAAGALGYVDTSGALRVYRTATWTAVDSIAVGTNARLSIASRGNTIAIAWDQIAGSYGVLAAQTSGTTWTRLGRALDVDIAGDAIAPAIAIDSSGAPLVAWTELVEGKQRGVLAKWSGSSWSTVGGITWLPSTGGAPIRSELALAAGDIPVVATASSGTAIVTRFNGPRIAATGPTTRASMSGCSLDVTAPPNLLSQTGCFDLSTPNKPVAHAGLVPYDVVVELWSDASKKRRWIGLPDGAPAMTLNSSNGSWTPPTGTMMVKEFALETTPGNPATRRPVETRFIVFDASGLKGFSYRWNTAGTDATLQPDTAQTINWTMDDGSQHPHVYPSRAHCNPCHYPAMGPILGLRPEQLQRWYDYDGTIAPQLPTLVALGVGPASSTQPLISPHEPSATFEQRTRGYMAGNCQHCHNPQYINIKDLRYTTPLANTKLCDVIVPGDPSQSVVYQKVTSRPGMPPLGTALPDPLMAQILGGWISGMTSCP
jgi:hypothetical protein